MSKSFDDLLAMVKQCPKKKVSVAVAQVNEVLQAVKEAKEQGIAEQIICNKQNCNDYFYKMYYKQTPDLMKGWYKECVGHIDYDSLFAE